MMVVFRALFYVVFFLLIAADFSVRFMINADVKNYTRQVAEYDFQLPVRMSNQSTTSMLGSYAEQLGDVKQSVSGTMSEKEQNLQSGILEQLFAGDKRVRLSAVINQIPAPKYALLSITESNNQAIQKKLQIGDALLGYDVVDLSLSSLTLNSIKAPKRSVILTLYQKHSSSQDK